MPISITDLLQPADVYLDVELASKKDVLRFLSDRVSEKCASRADFCRQALAAREKLGSTAIGSGIAFPHAQLEGLERAMAIFVRLETAVPYAAADAAPVDLIMMLLTPAGDTKSHLDGLASFSRALRSDERLQALRAAATADEIMAAFGH